MINIESVFDYYIGKYVFHELYFFSKKHLKNSLKCHKNVFMKSHFFHLDKVWKSQKKYFSKSYSKCVKII